MSGGDDQMKRMADLLRSGAVMLFEHCPVCSTPLFKLNDEIRCPKCNKRVLKVKEGEEDSVLNRMHLDSMEKIVMGKVQETTLQIQNEQDTSKLRELGSLIMTWLEVLEKLKRIQKTI